MTLDLTNINSTRAAFSTWPARQPEEIRPHGRSIDQNLKILSRGNLGEKDKAAALIALRDNLVKFEKMRAKFRSLMPRLGHLERD